MCREIRKVPANWEHPPQNPLCPSGKYRPLYQNWDKAREEWKRNFLAWEADEFIDDVTPEVKKKYKEYWQWNSPPMRENYADYDGRPCEWFQVYENGSEGTPTTPPFATTEELKHHLVTVGEYSYRQRTVWSEQDATEFISAECGIANSQLQN